MWTSIRAARPFTQEESRSRLISCLFTHTPYPCRMTFTLLRATAADVPALFRMRRAVEEHFATAHINQWPVGSMPEQEVAGYVASGEFYALRDESGTLVSAIRAMDADPLWGSIGFEPALYLHTLMTDPVHTSRGAGTAMLAAMDGVARERGENRVRLDCATYMIPFYEARGYSRTAHERPAAPPYSGFQLYLLEKHV